MTDTRTARISWEPLAYVVLAFAALSTRLFGLSDWAVYGDETFVISRALDRSITLINPIYYWLIVFSTNLLGIDEFAARLPAAVFGASSIIIFAGTWGKVVGTRAALLGACLLLLSNWHMHHSQYARFYAGVFLFSSLAYYFFYRALLLNSYRHTVAAIASAVAAVLFHVTAILVPAGCFAFSLLVLLKWPKDVAECPTRVARLYIALCIGCGLLVLPSLIGLLQHWTVDGTPPPGSLTILLRIVRAIGMPEIILGMLGLAVALRKQRLLACFSIVAVGLPVLAVVGSAEFLGMRNDYVFYILMFTALLGGIFVLEILEQAQRSLIAQGLVLSVFLLPLPYFLSHYTDKITLDVRDAVAYIESRHEPGDIIVSFSNEFTYYAEENFPVERRPASPIAGGTDWNAAMGQHTRSDERTWVVVRRNRVALVSGFENWLRENSSLVWRKFATRFDFQARGYEIWLVEP